MLAAAPGSVDLVIARLASLLNPGGWLQLVEMGSWQYSYGPRIALAQYLRTLRAMHRRFGMHADWPRMLGLKMEDACLIDIEANLIYVALGAAQENESLREKSIVILTAAVAPTMHVLRSTY